MPLTLAESIAHHDRPARACAEFVQHDSMLLGHAPGRLAAVLAQLDPPARNGLTGGLLLFVTDPYDPLTVDRVGLRGHNKMCM
ncbi:hypothetical protein [Actinomadura sp. NTSP31]|uniref:hypothetical protein n=1 Tax=Actinomadura sp. NTSP31 TaxID=1735447 RepID=UPI0035C0D246